MMKHIVVGGFLISGLLGACTSYQSRDVDSARGGTVASAPYSSAMPYISATSCDGSGMPCGGHGGPQDRVDQLTSAPLPTRADDLIGIRCTWDEMEATPQSEWHSWPARWRAEAVRLDAVARQKYDPQLEFLGGPTEQYVAKACRSLASDVEGALARVDAKMKLPDASIGMTTYEVEAGRWGKPDHVNRTVTAADEREQWVYPHGYLYFVGGRLVSIETSTR